MNSGSQIDLFCRYYDAARTAGKRYRLCARKLAPSGDYLGPDLRIVGNNEGMFDGYIVKPFVV
jgi:hypothetical protein